MKVKYENLFIIIAAILLATKARCAAALQSSLNAPLSALKNYHVDTPSMVSSGLLNQEHFDTFKVINVVSGYRINKLNGSAEPNLIEIFKLNGTTQKLKTFAIIF